MYLFNYKKDHIWLQYVTLVLLVSSITMLVWLVYLQHQAQPQPKFFRVTANKQVVQQQPLDKPALAANELLNWFTKAIMESYSFNYHNLYESIKGAHSFYTKNGHTSYIDALRNYNNLAAITKYQLVVTPTPLDVPKILKEQVVNGRYAWKVQIPISLAYQSSGLQTTREYTLTAFVVRVPANESPNGVQIAQIISSKSASPIFGR